MRIPHLRWWIAGMIFLASVLNYIDRQTPSILAPTIQRELQLTNKDYASVVNLFLVAYTASLVLSGRLVDRIGVRASLALFVGWWSVANILTAFSRSLSSLGAFRFMLGLGEAGNWTAAPKAVAEWFPACERGTAIGLYTLGATLGATIAPILVVGMSTRFGWQAVFVVTGLAGLVWLVPWLWLYRRPAENPHITERERMHVAGAGAAPDAATAPAEGWRAVLRRREVWRLMLARLLTDPVWYFYQFWFAKYLHDERGVGQTGLAVTWIIFLAADIGTLGGGWFSGQLIKRRYSPPASRLRIMLAAACVIPVSCLVPQVEALPLVLGIGMLVVFAHMSWLINLSALVVDLVPARSLATTFGLIAAGSSAGGIAMNWAVGRLVTHYSYGPAFVAMACVHPLALLLNWRLRKSPSAL